MTFCCVLSYLTNFVDKFPQVMKCVWRIIKAVPKWLSENSLNMDDVFVDIHDFLKSFPSAYWKNKDNDTPVR